MPDVTRPTAITGLLRAWSDGDATALDVLIPLVERDLHRLARAHMARERRDHTLQATALVNEAFLRLNRGQQVDWQDRAHFLGIAARLMRRVLVDHARRRTFQKRGGRHAVIPLEEGHSSIPAPDVNLLALDRALDALSDVDTRKATVVEMRYFGGMTIDETADALGISVDTVKRDWQVAKLFLVRALQGDQ